MKKHFFIVTVVAALGVTVFSEISQLNKNEQELNFQLQNVEALADDEVESIKCNAAITATCIVINGKAVKGERY